MVGRIVGIAHETLDRLVQQPAVSSEMLTPSNPRHHDADDIVCLDVILDETTEEMTRPKRRGRVHCLVVEDEHVDSPVNLCVLVRRNSIRPGERPIGHGGIDLDDGNVNRRERRNRLRYAVFENLEV